MVEVLLVRDLDSWCICVVVVGEVIEEDGAGNVVALVALIYQH